MLFDIEINLFDLLRRKPLSVSFSLALQQIKLLVNDVNYVLSVLPGTNLFNSFFDDAKFHQINNKIGALPLQFEIYLSDYHQFLININLLFKAIT